MTLHLRSSTYLTICQTKCRMRTHIKATNSVLAARLVHQSSLPLQTRGISRTELYSIPLIISTINRTCCLLAWPSRFSRLANPTKFFVVKNKPIEKGVPTDARPTRDRVVDCSHLWQYIYRPPTKWQEGNVFSCVYPSFCPLVALLPMNHWTSQYRVPLQPQQPLDIRHGTYLDPSPDPASDTWWPSLETCSNLFTWWPPHTEIWWPPKKRRLAVSGTHPTGMLPCILLFNF